VKQSGGSLGVPRSGTGIVVQVYLPRVEEAADASGDVRGEREEQGAETILLVENGRLTSGREHLR